MTNETIQGLKRISYLPDRDALDSGTLIAGQEYSDVEFIGGNISNVDLANIQGFTIDSDELASIKQGLNIPVSVRDYGAIGNGSINPLSNFYSTLAAAQVKYPHATSLTNTIDWCAIQLAINSGVKYLYFPGGTYIFNQNIILNDYFTWYGDGSDTPLGSLSAPQGTVIRRLTDVQIIGLGSSITIGPFGPKQRFCASGITFDGADGAGGGDILNSNAHYLSNLLDFRACYEFYFDNCLFTNCARTALYGVEFWDSRFNRCRLTFIGSADGTYPGFHLKSDLAGYEYTNNIYFADCRMESCPGVVIYFDGNNGSSFFFVNNKVECVNTNIDYLFKFNRAASVIYNGWAYCSPSNYNGISWSSSTSNTIGTGSKTLTIATGLTNIPVNRYICAYSSSNPQSWMSGYVTAYTSGSGSMTFTSDYTSPDSSGGSITDWILKPMHPGMMLISNTRLVNLVIHGGRVDSPSGHPPQKSYVTITGTETLAVDIDLKLIGSNLLPSYAFMGWSDAATTLTPGAGDKSFTIATGLVNISVGDTVIASGNGLGTVTNWMVGRVTAYNSGTGALTIRVSAGMFAGSSNTGWTITKYNSAAVTFSGLNTENIPTNIRITGGNGWFGYARGTNIAGDLPEEHSSISLKKYGSPALKFYNLNTPEAWSFDVTSDPSSVSGTTENTGKFVFSVNDFARATTFTPWYISGDRKMYFNQDLTMNVASSGLVLKQGANGKCGTFTLTAGAATVSNTSIAITDTVNISLNTVGGTIAAQPYVATITANTGFTVAGGGASNTSTYNYTITSNKA